MTGSDQQSQTGNGGLWERLIKGLEHGDLQPGTNHLEAGRPIYMADRHTPDSAVVKQYPNGHRELIRIDPDGENLIGPLPTVEPRI